jgi:hypothetical protein
LASTLKDLGTKPAGIPFNEYISESQLRVIKVSGYWQNALLAVIKKIKTKRKLLGKCLVLAVRFDGDLILFPGADQI